MHSLQARDIYAWRFQAATRPHGPPALTPRSMASAAAGLACGRVLERSVETQKRAARAAQGSPAGRANSRRNSALDLYRPLKCRQPSGLLTLWQWQGLRDGCKAGRRLRSRAGPLPISASQATSPIGRCMPAGARLFACGFRQAQKAREQQCRQCRQQGKQEKALVAQQQLQVSADHFEKHKA